VLLCLPYGDTENPMLFSACPEHGISTVDIFHKNICSEPAYCSEVRQLKFVAYDNRPGSTAAQQDSIRVRAQPHCDVFTPAYGAIFTCMRNNMGTNLKPERLWCSIKLNMNTSIHPTAVYQIRRKKRNPINRT
jgi:hypothetical protein